MASPSEASPAGGVARRSTAVHRFALSDAAAFDRCLACRPALRNGVFALHLFRHPATGESDGADSIDDRSAPVWRLGLVIPKRYEASAVARNTIKRRWRAAFRMGRDAWAGEFGSADLVVRMQSPLAPKAELAATPPKVRARSRFDPQAALASLADRLRRRDGLGARMSA